MTFWGTLLALAWEQVAPLFRPSQMERLFQRYAGWVHDRFNAGTRAHGMLAWAVAVLAPALAVALVGKGLEDLAGLLGLAWSAAVLYRCMGFRMVFDQGRALAQALDEGDDARAREKMAALGLPEGVGMDVVVPAAMGQLFRLGLARLFGVLFWFLLLGVFGAVAYALTRLLVTHWRDDCDFSDAVAQVVPVLDWLPARLLAFSFAIVGNFEQAMVAWRSGVAGDAPLNEGVVAAAGQGALGLDAETPGTEHIVGAIGLLNRAAVLWLGLLGLLWLGGL